MDRPKWMKHCVSIFFIGIFICSLVLATQALFSEKNIKSGITTFQFRFSTILDDGLLGKRAPQNLDFIGSIQIPDVATRFRNVAGAAATSIIGIVGEVPDMIKQLIPKNCSVGTGKFCVGLHDNMSCSDLPLNLSQIIPSDIEIHLRESFDTIATLDTALMKVTAPYLRNSLIIGLVFIFVLISVLISSMYGWLPFLGGIILTTGWLGVVGRIVFGMVLCIPFFIPTLILHILRSKLEQSPSWIQVQQGDVYRLCVGCLCCAVAIVLVASAVPIAFLSHAPTRCNPASNDVKLDHSTE